MAGDRRTLALSIFTTTCTPLGGIGTACPALAGRGSGVRVAGGGMNVGVSVGATVGGSVNDGSGVSVVVGVTVVVGVPVGVDVRVAVAELVGPVMLKPPPASVEKLFAALVSCGSLASAVSAGKGPPTAPAVTEMVSVSAPGLGKGPALLRQSSVPPATEHVNRLPGALVTLL